MSITRIQGHSPYVIDRKLPSIFERSAGARELVAQPNADNEPMRFETHDEAVEFLCSNLDRESINAYDWRVEPEA